MLLVIAYSQQARAALRNAAATHSETVVRRFGRVVLFEASAFGEFLACRFRAEFGGAVQVERLEPFVPDRDVDDRVQSAAEAYADRDAKSTSYAKFAVGTEHPSPSALKSRDR
ncbi:MAG: hypothetical protein ABEJ57_01020 [Halobacteriaceae archaeon]